MKLPTKIAKRLKLAQKYYLSLVFADCSKTKLLSANKKLQKTGASVTGVQMYPALAGSCSDYGDCILECIQGTGIGQVVHANKDTLTAIDKCNLRRLWLHNNERDYFYAQVKIELRKIQDDFKTVYFREVSTETIDHAAIGNNRSIKCYGYFKNIKKIDRLKERGYWRAMYSWNEKSAAVQIDDCKTNNVPIAVVVPNKVFKVLLESKAPKGIYYHNGTADDLASIKNYKRGKINLHLLAKRTSKNSKYVTKNRFMESYSNLLENLSIESV